MSKDSWAFIDRTARAMGVKDAARQKWKSRGVPHRWRLPLSDAAAQQGVKLTLADFECRGGEGDVIEAETEDTHLRRKAIGAR